MSEMREGRERLYDLVEERRFKKRNPNDPLEEVIEEEDRELARKARRMRLEEIIAEKEKKMRELRMKESSAPPAEVSIAQTLGLLGGDPKKIDEALKNLSPEAMRNLMLIISASSGNPNMLLPIAMMTRAEAKPTEIAETIAKYVELLTKKGEGSVDVIGIVDRVDIVSYGNPRRFMLSFGTLRVRLLRMFTLIFVFGFMRLGTFTGRRFTSF